MDSSPELFVNSDMPDAIQIITDRAEIEKVEALTGKNVGIVYEDAYIMLLKDAVLFPNGLRDTYIRIISQNAGDGVIIVPIKKHKILLINHYRHALRCFSWELPRGFAEKNTSVIENVQRELLEECGVVADKCKILGRIAPDSGMLGSKPWVVLSYFSSDSYVLDKKESINECIEVTLDEAIKMIAASQIVDSFTISALFLAIAKKAI